MPEQFIHDKAKEAAGKAASELIQNGMTVGLGTGSTAAYFIKHLAFRCQNGLKIKAIATSSASETLAKKGGIPLLDEKKIKTLDIAIDGADEIDCRLQMIKGGGGALLREKIIACMANEMIAIVDQKKYVKTLGAFPLPIEVSCFGIAATLHHLRQYHPKVRPNFLSDNGNFIVDLHLKKKIRHVEELDRQLKSIPGVLETGLFVNIAKMVIIGYEDGSTRIL